MFHKYSYLFQFNYYLLIQRGFTHSQQKPQSLFQQTQLRRKWNPD